ncbi:protein of unknown function [Actinokineospora alba]|uniref:DUF397 domain-containing protein n=1 Tax=Actinokineospora alba TaxID=504798 RepID=A0A1H0U007_9PSEU|nr:DUF397 domain-containing protein [Actinokineospora alba]TDP70809.1 uncharacterized protein DUF397 [Actinokineospora alba]SDJ17073.1 protein of unknown function [Actinokineospora alba]SDP59278.1 protein of unknown function [Actinokineospora alba]
MHAEWRKSSFSGAQDADCIEVSYSAEVWLRDSKKPEAGTLRLPASSWQPAHLTSLVVRPG